MNKVKLMELKAYIEVLEEKSQEISQKRLEFDESNKLLIDSIKEINLNITNLKEELKVCAITKFNETGLKALDGGIGIRIMTVLNYDPIQALNWAKEKDLFLRLDTTSFEKVAKTGEIDFVKIEERTTVTFPKHIKKVDI